MSYQVLARKWRPKIFREMVGQEHVLRALINALDHDRLHHAYLFTGTRGVGKTTIARILAKCLNCESGVSSEPCGQCGSCLEIAEGRSIDLIEVDAASRTKVEDTRELLDNVQYAPTASRFKVYLIDEVHMLSTHSFNALLKTLEEPPPHVKFLFATTDPQKLPATILSRCLQFNLKNMPPQQIVGHLQHVLQQEMVSFEEPALWLLGRAADGSMRDALSLTDQAIAFGSGQVLENDVRTMLGSVDMGYIYQLLEAITGGEPPELLAIVGKMAEHAPDFEGSLAELISMIHRVAVAQAIPDALDNSWGDAQRIGQLAQSISAEDVQLYYQVAINGKRDMPFSADPRSGFEMILLRMIAFRPAAVLDENLSPQDLKLAPPNESQGVVVEVDNAVKKSREASLPATLPPETVQASNPEPQPQAKQKPKPVPPQSVKIADPQPRAATVIADKASVEGKAFSLDQLHPLNWPALLEQLGLHGIVYNIASHCELRSCDNSTLAFIIDENNASLFNEKHRSRIATVLENYFDTKLSVSVESGEPLEETPAMQKTRLAAQRQREAVVAIESDPVLQQLLERFDGELVQSSIVPSDC